MTHTLEWFEIPDASKIRHYRTTNLNGDIKVPLTQITGGMYIFLDEYPNIPLEVLDIYTSKKRNKSITLRVRNVANQEDLTFRNFQREKVVIPQVHAECYSVVDVSPSGKVETKYRNYKRTFYFPESKVYLLEGAKKFTTIQIGDYERILFWES